MICSKRTAIGNVNVIVSPSLRRLSAGRSTNTVYQSRLRSGRCLAPARPCVRGPDYFRPTGGSCSFPGSFRSLWVYFGRVVPVSYMTAIITTFEGFEIIPVLMGDMLPRGGSNHSLESFILGCSYYYHGGESKLFSSAPQ